MALYDTKFRLFGRPGRPDSRNQSTGPPAGLGFLDDHGGPRHCRLWGAPGPRGNHQRPRDGPTKETPPTPPSHPLGSGHGIHLARLQDPPPPDHLIETSESTPSVPWRAFRKLAHAFQPLCFLWTILWVFLWKDLPVALSFLRKPLLLGRRFHVCDSSTHGLFLTNYKKPRTKTTIIIRLLIVLYPFVGEEAPFRFLLGNHQGRRRDSLSCRQLRNVRACSSRRSTFYDDTEGH